MPTDYVLKVVFILCYRKPSKNLIKTHLITNEIFLKQTQDHLQKHNHLSSSLILCDLNSQTKHKILKTYALPAPSWLTVIHVFYPKN